MEIVEFYLDDILSCHLNGEVDVGAVVDRVIDDDHVLVLAHHFPLRVVYAAEDDWHTF